MTKASVGPAVMPGRRLEHRIAIGDRQRRHDPRAALRQVFGRQNAAGGMRIGGDRSRDVALIEIIRAGLGEPIQRIGEPAER